ncbi:hypothetical protein HYX70_01450 [Candidatus Saccharibacteria bacterium]|nr:hypothetical protein [Candidatus Saccharibacteria bacterium]
MKSKLKKSAKVTAVAIAASVMLLAGAVPAMAANSSEHKPNLVDKIASAFHLNHDDVQSRVQDFRAEKQQDRRAKLEARLTQAVKDGNLSEAQKSAILQKVDELKSFADSLKDKSSQDRQAAIKAQHLALVQ